MTKGEHIAAIFAIYWCIFEIAQLVSIPLFGLRFYYAGYGHWLHGWQGIVCGVVQQIIILAMLYHIYCVWRKY